MRFSRLRLTGFKSFVDATDLSIEPGLTGIVGPNGCGKSNLVDALRWVMGESSARQMRGHEMDDVIFSGSASRPLRNHAEVAVLLDNAARTAPAAFNDFSEIEVSRRIERGAGSVYRINGKETRARDVQLLFADEVTGARSTALVGQGEIGGVIAAKPAQRRGLLDEAAGITGLHSRRHEAELRLGAAETNLERLDDVMGALDAQLQGLKRQAREAVRYRRLGERMRQTEALLLHRRWRIAETAVAEAGAALAEAERTVAGLERDAAGAGAGQAKAASALPPLREAEAAAGAVLHRLEVAQVELEAEERRLADARDALETRLGQIDGDVERERALTADAEEAVSRLEAEAAALAAAQRGEDEAASAAAAARAEAADALAAIERQVDELTAERAAADARRAALDRQIDDLDSRAERLGVRAAEVERDRTALDRQAGASPDDADAALAAARSALEAARAAAARAEGARRDRQAEETAARDALRDAETACAALHAEEAALAGSLGEAGSGAWSALIDEITVEAGWETALGAALGDDLSASSDADAPVHWGAPAGDGPAPPLPAGAEPLSRYVTAPAALARRLSQIGVVAPADGPRLHGALAQGQRLVDRGGALWRWDGFTVKAEVETPAALRLRQRNRLAALRGELAAGEPRREKTVKELAAARDALEGAGADEAGAREALSDAEAALDSAREAHAKAAAAVAADASRRANLSDAAAQLATDLGETEAQRDAARAARDALPPDTEGRAELDALRAALAERRAALAECDGAVHRVQRESADRRERLAAVDDELGSWRARAEGAAQRQAQLAERRKTAAGERDALANRPAEIAKRRGELLDRLSVAQDERRRASDAVAAAENELAERDRRLKEAEAALGQAREERVRREGDVSQAAAARDEVGRAVAERLGCKPAELAGLAGIDDGAEQPDAPDVEEAETRLARLVRQRDGMGPVNLRADTEAAEIDEQLTALRDDHADLEAAIARLRQAIARLNREGRERLLTAFEAINGHFGTLFTRLFGGRQAHLSLVESDDPLEAGLEIMASPPGKRLQVLSLLSGGEQALTALALLFAVFLTNPTPICVLDEVDAPLDDANVGRFCDLVEEIAHGSATRFLVVTHNAITMARVDRLFGVTMSERGVSQLVSVDLRAAGGLRAAG